MILGRIILLLNAPHHSLINVDHLTKIFVTSDLVSFPSAKRRRGTASRQGGNPTAHRPDPRNRRPVLADYNLQSLRNCSNHLPHQSPTPADAAIALISTVAEAYARPVRGKRAHPCEERCESRAIHPGVRGTYRQPRSVSVYL